MSFDKHLRVQLALTEAQQSQLRASHFRVRIESGVYKSRVVHKGSSTGPLMSEEELLKDEVQIMAAHIRRAEDHLDYAKELLFT